MLNGKEIVISMTEEEYKKYVECVIFAEKQAKIDELEQQLATVTADKDYWLDQWCELKKSLREANAQIAELQKQLSDLQDELQAADEKAETREYTQ